MKLAINRIVILIILLAGTLSIANAQSYKESARSNLKKWGVAYCMSKTSTGLKMDTLYGNVQGEYFELGAHSDKAFKEIKSLLINTVKHDIKEKNIKILLFNSAWI